MLTVKDLDVDNKRVLVRVDFNVPLNDEGQITDDTRIRASLPTIQYLLDHNAMVILMSHLGRPKGKSPKLSLEPCRKRLSELLNRPVTMAIDCIGPDVDKLVADMLPQDILMLENLRFYPAEEDPDSDLTFSKKLAQGKDLYVNDAFGCAHRKHSSTASIATYFPGKSACGFLLEKEINLLGNALKTPKRPFFAIIGGAKVSTKIGVLKALSSQVDALMLGGGMAYTFLQALGIPVGDSLVEPGMVDTAKEILNGPAKIYLPLDIVAATKFDNDAPTKTFLVQEGIPSGYQGMDIGPKTIEAWKSALQNAKTILWNGPVGVFEMPHFAKGTHAIAEALASLQGAITIVGGGDSVAAVQEYNLADRFTHISTGGGAALEYVEFGTLPGIDALK